MPNTPTPHSFADDLHAQQKRIDQLDGREDGKVSIAGAENEAAFTETFLKKVPVLIDALKKGGEANDELSKKMIQALVAHCLEIPDNPDVTEESKKKIMEAGRKFDITIDYFLKMLEEKETKNVNARVITVLEKALPDGMQVIFEKQGKGATAADTVLVFSVGKKDQMQHTPMVKKEFVFYSAADQSFQFRGQSYAAFSASSQTDLAKLAEALTETKEEVPGLEILKTIVPPGMDYVSGKVSYESPFPKGATIFHVRLQHQSEPLVLLYDLADKKLWLNGKSYAATSPSDAGLAPARAHLKTMMEKTREDARKAEFLELSLIAADTFAQSNTVPKTLRDTSKDMPQDQVESAYNYYVKTLEKGEKPLLPFEKIAEKMNEFNAAERAALAAGAKMPSRRLQYFGMLVSNSPKLPAMLDNVRVTTERSLLLKKTVELKIEIHRAKPEETETLVSELYKTLATDLDLSERQIAAKKALGVDADLLAHQEKTIALDRQHLALQTENKVGELHAASDRAEKALMTVIKSVFNPAQPEPREAYNVFVAQSGSNLAKIAYLKAELASLQSKDPAFVAVFASQKEDCERELQEKTVKQKETHRGQMEAGAALHELGIKGHEQEYAEFTKIRLREIDKQEGAENAQLREVRDSFKNTKEKETAERKDANAKLLGMAQGYSATLAKLERGQLEGEMVYSKEPIKINNRQILGMAIRLQKNIGDYLSDDARPLNDLQEKKWNMFDMMQRVADAATEQTAQHSKPVSKDQKRDWVIHNTDNLLWFPLHDSRRISKNLYSSPHLGFHHEDADPQLKAQLLPLFKQFDARLQTLIQHTLETDKDTQIETRDAHLRVIGRMGEAMKVMKETQKYIELASKKEDVLTDEEKSQKKELEKSGKVAIDRMIDEVLQKKLRAVFEDPQFKKDVAFLRTQLPSLRNVFAPALHTGEKQSELEKKLQANAENFQNMNRFFQQGGELDKIVNGISNLDPDTTWNNATYWLRTNGVIIGIAVASTIAICSVVGAPAGTAGYLSLAASITVNAVVGGAGSTIGSEIGKEVVGIYEKGYQSKFGRELFTGNLSAETLKEFGWDLGGNIALMGGFSIAGKAIGSLASKAAVSNNAVVNALRLPTLARGTVATAEGMEKFFKRFGHLGGETLQEYFEEGWESLISQLEFNPTGNKYIDRAGQFLLGSLASVMSTINSTDVDVRVKAGVAIDLSYLKLDTAGKVVDMTYKADTTRPLAEAQVKAAAVLAQLFQVDPNAMYLNPKTGDISFEAKTGEKAKKGKNGAVQNITTVHVHPSLESPEMRGFSLARPKQMAAYGITFDESTGTYTFDPARAKGSKVMLDLETYLREQGFIVTQKAGGGLHVQSGEIDTHFTPVSPTNSGPAAS